MPGGPLPTEDFLALTEQPKTLLRLYFVPDVNPPISMNSRLRFHELAVARRWRLPDNWSSCLYSKLWPSQLRYCTPVLFGQDFILTFTAEPEGISAARRIELTKIPEPEYLSALVSTCTTVQRVLSVNPVAVLCDHALQLPKTIIYDVTKAWIWNDVVYFQLDDGSVGMYDLNSESQACIS